MNAETETSKGWINDKTALLLMITLFICLGSTTSESPMAWWMRLVSSSVIGLWMPGWFYERLSSEEDHTTIFGNLVRFAGMMIVVAFAGVLSIQNIPGLFTAIILGFAGVRALEYGRTGIADILGMGAFVLTLLSAILA